MHPTAEAHPPHRRTHPHASLADAVRSVLRSYYDEPWLSERDANITMAIVEPDITIADLAVMLQESGIRPAAADPTAPYGGHAWGERCMIAGHICNAALRHHNRRVRLEVV